RVPPEITTGLPSPNLSYAMTVPSGDLTFSDIRTSYQVRLVDLMEPNLWPRVVYSQFPGRNRDTTHEVMSRQLSWEAYVFVGGQLTGRNGFTYLISGALGRLLIGGRRRSHHRLADFQGSMQTLDVGCMHLYRMTAGRLVTEARPPQIHGDETEVRRQALTHARHRISAHAGVIHRQ